jgi:aspartyl-tRNA synthetase
MERSYIDEVLNKKEAKVKISGWVHDVRDLSKVKFLVLRDKSGVIQVTGIKGITPDNVFEELDKIPRESVISIEGKSVKSKQALGGMEVNPEKIEIISKAEHPLPIDVSDFSKTELPKRLDWRSLSLRSKKSRFIFKIQSKIVEGMQEWLNVNGFQQVFTPCLMGIASESGSEVFEVKYFNKKAFLRQDPQLHRQLTIAGGIEKLYDIGSSWRAEKSNTVRHLCEHRTCAVELSFIKDERDVMRVEEQVIISAFKKVNEDCKKELEELKVELKIPKAPFLEFNFPELYKIIAKLGKRIEEGEDLDLEAERLLWKYVQEKYPGNDFYFVNKFPFKKKPFYVYKDKSDDYARSTDLYYRGIEMSSGGQRENRYDILIKNVKEKNMNPKLVEWFTQTFRYGVPTHGGFAIGIERITMVLLGLDNVREAVLFPRDPDRTAP